MEDNKRGWFCLILLCLSGIAAAAEGVDDLTIWRASASMLDNIRVTYAAESGPSEKGREIVAANPFPAEHANSLAMIFSRSKSSVTMTQQGQRRRFDVQTQMSTDDLAALGRVTNNTPGWHATEDFAQVRTGGNFKYLDRINHSGAIWADWPDDPKTLVDMANPPAEKTGTFTKVDGQDHVYDFRTSNGKGVIRYYLDPQNGMMPRRIDCFQAPEPLFLYRFTKIAKYECRDGVYVPAEATTYDMADGTDGSWEVEEHLQATQIETNVKLDAKDFDLQFPPGTTVHNHITDISYTVRESGTDYLDPGQVQKDTALSGLVAETSPRSADDAQPTEKSIDVSRAAAAAPVTTPRAPLAVSQIRPQGLLARMLLGVIAAAVVVIALSRVRRAGNR